MFDAHNYCQKRMRVKFSKQVGDQNSVSVNRHISSVKTINWVRNKTFFTGIEVYPIRDNAKKQKIINKFNAGRI